jgi:UDP-N-acetylmuramate dehydrogenase
LNEVSEKIKLEFLNAKFFPVDDSYTKVPAGWLIENAGLKGKSFGKVSIYYKNALVLVNTNNATYEDIISTRDEIVKTVKEKFGIELEQEPEII